MKLNQEIFAIKLYEMEQEYGKLQSRLRICGREDHGKIREKLEKAKSEYKEKELILRQSIDDSRSPAVSVLAAAQLECQQKAENLLKEQLGHYLHSELSTVKEDEAEAATLYAEYAIDFSTQAMQYALIAALKAIDLQMSLEEQKEGKEDETK